MGSDIKRSFLKRKSHNLLENSTAKKGICTTAKKNYKYYADRFKKDDVVKPRKLKFDDDASDNQGDNNEAQSRNFGMNDKSATDKDDGLIEIVVNEKRRNPFSSEKKRLRGMKS